MTILTQGRKDAKAQGLDDLFVNKRKNLTQGRKDARAQEEEG